MRQFFNIVIPASSTAFVKQTFPKPVRKFKIMAAQGIKIAMPDENGDLGDQVFNVTSGNIFADFDLQTANAGAGVSNLYFALISAADSSRTISLTVDEYGSRDDPGYYL